MSAATAVLSTVTDDAVVTEHHGHSDRIALGEHITPESAVSASVISALVEDDGTSDRIDLSVTGDVDLKSLSRQLVHVNGASGVVVVLNEVHEA